MYNPDSMVIFDLDGVLVETKQIHYDALNYALEKAGEQIISWNDHLTRYDGFPTKVKLDMLGIIDTRVRSSIIHYKNHYTRCELASIIKDNYVLIELFHWLWSHEIRICVASNAIRETIELCLEKLGVATYVDMIVSNEDVNHRKPHPEMYWKCMIEFGVMPTDTLIVEDSAVGRVGAYASGARVWEVLSPKDVTLENYMNVVENRIPQKTKWIDKKLNVVIPMAGLGSRFSAQGYTFPKPLIEVRNKPMIQVVVENLNIEANYIYIVQEEHYQKYNLKQLLNLITPGCQIIQINGVTEGAAVTVMKAIEYINNDNPLIIANSDQFVEWDSNETMYSLYESGVDGGILTFKSTHPKWSFAELNDDGFVKRVAEKNPISDNATVGIYYWKRGRDFVDAATKMFEYNDRFNGEFYVCPVFNYAIVDGKKFVTKEVKNMWGLGTPEDLNYFLNNHEGIV